MMRSNLTIPVLAGGLCLLSLGGTPAVLHAQIPDTFTNLRVLPADITKPELMDAMKGFASGLGVRCTHCHVGEDGPGFAGFDFASDAKPTKKAARLMWTMVKDINERQLAALDAHAAEPGIQVSCETCHRGQDQPRLTADLLLDICRHDGVDSAVARYRALREEYYGTHTHDFSEFMLIKVVSALPDSGAAGAAGAAVRLLDLNLEMFPESAFSYFQRGMVYASENETDRAIADLQKALELQPGNRGARQMLSRLMGEK